MKALAMILLTGLAFASAYASSGRAELGTSAAVDARGRLSNLAQAQRTHPGLKVVTITTDSMGAAKQIAARLAQLGVESDAYAFSDAPQDALRFAIDPAWIGEKPRAYRYAADGGRQAVSGVITTEQFAAR